MAKIPEDVLGQFRAGQYLSMITYNKTGKEVTTPVWFVAESTKVYVATPKTTYKIKRIKNDARVKLAPCTRNGEVRGTYLKGSARIMLPEEEQAVSNLFRQKYGILFKFWSANVKNIFRKKERRENRLHFVEIMPSS